MKKIKSFIYLDEYQMYSLSSQIFEGLTEYIVNYSTEGNQNLETQKGPVGSGRVLGDIISKQLGQEERKFLHDYSYTLFENKLFEDNKVIVIDSENINKINVNTLDDYAFIKVVGRALFNDVGIINDTLKNINSLGEAIAYLQNFENLQNIDGRNNPILSVDKTAKGFAKKGGSQLSNISREEKAKEIAKELNLYFDQTFLDKVSLILNYGYGDQFEIKIDLFNSNENKRNTFSANLKRSSLKENENHLIKKYSRYSEKELVIFGIITQSQGKTTTNEVQEQINPEEMKEVVLNLTSALSGIEEKFVGKLRNEIIIDPIAVYREL